MRSALVLAGVLVLGLSPVPGEARSKSSEGGIAPYSSAALPRPPEMEHQVRFWRDVFTRYTSDQTLIHDTVSLDRVYSVVDVRGQTGYLSGADADSYRRGATDAEIERIRAILLRLYQVGPRGAATPEERRIAELFRNDPDPYKFLRAADGNRIRAQRGIRERFGSGFRESRKYLPQMEQIFRSAGLPIELTRIPLFESSFDLSAYSKVGAAGIWQFMPATGRLFMSVNDVVDERRDPISSTQAAAQYLTRAYTKLGNWPLAVTSYNHGPNGMARAVSELGTRNIVTVVRYWDGPGFGFASRNFYAELLAALDIDRNSAKYYGPFTPERLPATRTVVLDRPVDWSEAARLSRTPHNVLAGLNPALMDTVLSGRAPIPAGYGLRLPADGAHGFEDRLARLSIDQSMVR
jgi:membrane-bound lytic murein transglycosylase D